jgi:hypothetical protein
MIPKLSFNIASQSEVSGLRLLAGVGSRGLEDVDLESRNVVKAEKNPNWRQNNW